MKLHETTIRTNIPGAEMGEQLGRLRYDLLESTLIGLGEELRRQAYKDAQIGRPKLAKALENLADMIWEVDIAIGEVLHICQQYIQAEKKIQKNYPSVQLPVPVGYKDITQSFTSYNFRV